MNPAPVQSLLSRPVHTPVTLVPYEEPAEPAGPESGPRLLNEVLSCGYSYLGGADTGVLKSVLTVDLDPDMLLESPEGAAVIFPAEIYQAVFGKKIPELNENTVPGDISSRDEITLKELENASKTVKKPVRTVPR
ncbi:MAG: hypothetical protein ACLFST_06245 [Spirochaetia bacterium]